MLFMGIDGGGTNLRVVITDEALQQQTIAYQKTGNPNLIGRDEAKRRIQATMREAISQVNAEITAVGIGIAGASKAVADPWLKQVVREVLPNTHLVTSSDNEIGLVGALGKREGLMLLAGTGSGGFGVNHSGDALQVGGWGYLLGDEGSGYWLGMQALQHLTHQIDADTEKSLLSQRLIDDYALSTFPKIIDWVYQSNEQPIVPRVAQLTRTLLDCAQADDPIAYKIMEQGTTYLASLVDILTQRLNMPNPEITFTGSLITEDTPYRTLLLQKLPKSQLRESLYPPVIGAALLAKLDYQDTHKETS